LRVSKWIIETPEQITVEKIHAETNQEQRRVMLERIGWDRYLREANAKEIAIDEFGILLEVPGLGDGDDIARFVRVKDASTAREFTLRVPPTTKTAKEGVAGTFEVEEKDYQPIIQT
jgi:hypothetical protein